MNTAVEPGKVGFVRRCWDQAKSYVNPLDSSVGAKRSFWFAILSIPFYMVLYGLPILSILFSMLAVKMGVDSLRKLRRGARNGDWILSIIGITLGTAVFLFDIYTIYSGMTYGCGVERLC